MLRTNDDVHLIVPNSRFITDTIVNRAYDRPLYRCRVPVAVDHGSIRRRSRRRSSRRPGRCDGVLKEPSASVRFRSLGASGLNFELLCWTDQMFHRPGALISCLNFEIHEALTRRGIRLPQTEILLRRDEERPGGARPAAGMEDAELVGLEAPR